MVWVTPNGRLFFPEPHDKKNLLAIGAAAAHEHGDLVFDQSVLLDQDVERRRRAGRYHAEPVTDLPLYWWFLIDPVSEKIVLGPDPAAPTAHKETPAAARRRLSLGSAQGGFIYSRAPSSAMPDGGWRVTTEDHEPLPDRSIAPRIVAAVKHRESELVRLGARPRPWSTRPRSSPP